MSLSSQNVQLICLQYRQHHHNWYAFLSKLDHLFKTDVKLLVSKNWYLSLISLNWYSSPPKLVHLFITDVKLLVSKNWYLSLISLNWYSSPPKLDHLTTSVLMFYSILSERDRCILIMVLSDIDQYTSSSSGKRRAKLKLRL